LILIPALVANNSIKIRAGKDDNLAEYNEAKGYRLNPEKFKVGWARRPLVGRLYGVSYIEPHKQEIEAWVIAGINDKSEKKNPRQMYLEIAEKYKKFCRPGETEIRSQIDSVLKAAAEQSKKKTTTTDDGKKKKTTTKDNGKKKTTTKKGKKSDLPERLQEYCNIIIKGMQRRVKQKGWDETKPDHVFERLVEKLGVKLSKKDKSELSNVCRAKYSQLKTARKMKRAKLAKKALI
jgi:hypothetical protein